MTKPNKPRELTAKPYKENETDVTWIATTSKEDVQFNDTLGIKFIEKSAYDRAVEALKRIKRSFEVDYYDHKAVLADMEDEHKIAEQTLRDLGEIDGSD